MKISRRAFVGIIVAALAAIGITGGAALYSAQPRGPKELVVLGWGGKYEAALVKHVIESFEAESQ